MNDWRERPECAGTRYRLELGGEWWLWSLGVGEDKAVVAVGALKGHKFMLRKAKYIYFLKYYQQLHLFHNYAKKSSLPVSAALLPSGLAS